MEPDSLIPSRIEMAATDYLWSFLTVADAVHLRELVRAGRIGSAQAKEIEQALGELHGEKPLGATGGDLFDRRKQALQARGVPSGWMSLARARREAVTLAFHLKLRADFLSAQTALADSALALLESAGRHAETLIPDFTYWLAAQPSTWGHYLEAAAQPLLRAMERGEDLWRRLNLCPAGGGSTNGSRIAIDRAEIAKALGFDAPVANTRDAVWRSDLIFEVAAHWAAAALAVSRLSQDLLVLASEGFDLVGLPPALSRKSWILPQKNNPYGLAVLRGLASEVAAAPQEIWLLNHTPSHQCDNRIFTHSSLPRRMERTVEMFRLMSAIVKQLEVDTDKMRAACSAGFVQAPDAAEFLAEQGLDFEAACQTIRGVIEEGRYASFSLEMCADLAARCAQAGVRIDAKQLMNAIDPATAVSLKRQPGSCRPADLLARVEALKSVCENAARTWLHRQRDSSERIEAVLKGVGA